MGWTGFPIPSNFVWPEDDFLSWADEDFLRQFVEAFNETGAPFGIVAGIEIERGRIVQSFWRFMQSRITDILWDFYYVPSSFNTSLMPTDIDAGMIDGNVTTAWNIPYRLTLPPYKLNSLDTNGKVRGYAAAGLHPDGFTRVWRDSTTGVINNGYGMMQAGDFITPTVVEEIRKALDVCRDVAFSELQGASPDITDRFGMNLVGGSLIKVRGRTGLVKTDDFTTPDSAFAFCVQSHNSSEVENPAPSVFSVFPDFRNYEGVRIRERSSSGQDPIKYGGHVFTREFAHSFWAYEAVHPDTNLPIPAPELDFFYLSHDWVFEPGGSTSQQNYNVTNLTWNMTSVPSAMIDVAPSNTHQYEVWLGSSEFELSIPPVGTPVGRSLDLRINGSTAPHLLGFARFHYDFEYSAD